VHLGWLLALGGLAAGMWEENGAGLGWAALLLATGAGLAVGAYRAHRFPLCAYGLFAGYLALLWPVLEGSWFRVLGRSLWLFAWSAAMLVGLLAAHRGTREPR
jgi:hypothetical protein